jgi:hypothetical protein
VSAFSFIRTASIFGRRRMFYKCLRWFFLSLLITCFNIALQATSLAVFGIEMWSAGYVLTLMVMLVVDIAAWVEFY